MHCPEGADNERQESIAELILKENADVVQLNEFCLDKCQILDSLLNLHYSYKMDVGARGQAGDIFYSKKTVLESEKVNGIYNSYYAKIYTEGCSLYIIGCHLNSNNHDGRIGVDNADSVPKVKTFCKYYLNAQKKRCESVSVLIKVIKENPLPMIVMGDMNDFNHSAPMDSLKDVGMKNAWWEGGFGYGATYHEGWLRLRIDHIYYNDKLKLKDVKVVDTDLSDHNPVVAGFGLSE